MCKAQAFAEKAGKGRVYTNFVKMLDAEQPDAVFVCIPPISHGEGMIELELVERGIPFFVEKPIALSMYVARRVRDAVAAKKLITAVGFQLRHFVGVNFARRELACRKRRRGGSIGGLGQPFGDIIALGVVKLEF